MKHRSAHDTTNAGMHFVMHTVCAVTPAVVQACPYIEVTQNYEHPWVNTVVIINISRCQCQGITEYLNRFVLNTMDELPSRSQPVNPSHVTLNGLSH